MAVVIAANRTRHPLDARTLARLAAQYADRGVVGFGLSNDERRGTTRDFAPAFRIAERAGLLLVPHGGELLGAGARSGSASRSCTPTGSATASGPSEDPDLLDLIVSRGIALEVCPVSNVALGVYTDLTSVPLPDLMAAGATIALGADDPLLFGSRLAGQYATMRAAHELTDAQLADLARSSIRASRAAEEDKSTWLGEIDDVVGDNGLMTTYPGEDPQRRTTRRTPAADGSARGRAATPAPDGTEPTQPVGYWERQRGEQAGEQARDARAVSPTPRRRYPQGRAGVRPDHGADTPYGQPSPRSQGHATGSQVRRHASRTASRRTPSTPYGQPTPAAVRRAASRPGYPASRHGRPAGSVPARCRRYGGFAVAPLPTTRRRRCRWSSASSGWSAPSSSAAGLAGLAVRLGARPQRAQGDRGLAGPARRREPGADRDDHRHHRHGRC